MSTKSPGIYFSEHDNTAYSNPKSVSGTTVCVVGFATKGPIGKPVEITSYKSFTQTFGNPIEGYYSGLAVKNILTAGGKVLFVRVADSTASTSNIVVKNAVDAVNGKVTFDRASDILIGTAGYSTSSLYGINVKNAAGDSKDIYLRSPAAGKFTQASILSQLTNGLEPTVGTYEVFKRTMINPGVFSFEVAINDVIIDDSETEISEANQGFFIETTANESGQVLAEALQQAITNGPNGVCMLTLSVDKSGENNGYFDVNQRTFADISGNKRLLLTKGTTPITVKIDITAGSTVATMANLIDSAISSYGVRCLLLEGNQDENTPPKLLFVNKTGSEDLAIVTSTTENESLDELFLTNKTRTETEDVYNEVTETTAGDNPSELGWYEFVDDAYVLSEDTEVDPNKVYYTKSVVTTVISELPGFAPANLYSPGLYINDEFDRTSSSGRTNVSVTYNEDTKSIIFSGITEGAGEKIEAVPAPYGNFIFDPEKGANVGTVVGSILGSDAITGLSIARDPYSRKVFIESENEIQNATVANVEGNENILSLITIEKNVNDASSIGYTYSLGRIAIDATQRDMVVLTSKEKGSGTAGIISVEFYSTTSPITGNVRHDITISVDGILKETYENVSYNYSDVENRFDTLINQTEDNGGSSYITALVVKNDLADPEVQIRDGVYTIGSPESEESVKRLPDVAIDAYASYDYSVGDAGIPEDGGDEYFEEAMTIGTSALADKDLYTFHILITPDNISETVQMAAIELCESRGDAMAIIDPPVGLSRDAVINWHNGRGYGRSTALQSTYAATYWPWCKVYDSNQAKNIWVMPSVVMAAKYVTVDRTAGCWYAPAGETNGVMSVIDIEQYPNVIDRDKLYVDYNRINPFIRLGDGSIVCYGEKTLQRINSVLTKVHTRRMLIQVKKEAKEALRGYIFMPNTPEYLAKISSNLTAIFEKYKSGGGITFYSVVCDESNNPIETRLQDIINVTCVIVPTGCIEQVNINLTLNRTTETVSVN